MIFKKEVKEALEKAKHPELGKSLSDVGMIRKIEIEKEKVTITLVVPFLHVPIKKDLIKIIKETIKKEIGVKTKVLLKEMNEKEKKYFGKMVRKIRGSSPW